jgi:hypothetical protein
MTNNYFASLNENSELKDCLIEGMHEIPKGSISIDREIWVEIIQNRSSIWRYEKNKFVKYPAPDKEPSIDELILAERSWRDGELKITDYAVIRHRDEIEMKKAETLSADQYQELQEYRMELRGWPEHPKFPDAGSRPESPGFMTEKG